MVGSGFYGAVVAHNLLHAGVDVTVVEKRDHLGGNCYTRPLADGSGHEHVYGPHIFHTNSTEIWDFVSQFTNWIPYVHRPKARYHGVLYSLPFNLMTFQQVYGVSTPAEAKRKLESVRKKISNPQNLEEWCLSQVGPDIYERFVRGYTKKQWQKDPKDLPASIIKRLPIRFSFDDNYFFDRYQGIPKDGYTAIFERLLDGVEVHLSTDFLEEKERWIERFDHIIYSGPLDALFDYSEGALEYRSLRFENTVMNTNDFQGVSQINETEEAVPYTRVIEHKHFYQRKVTDQTLVTYEYPERWSPGKVEYYPIETEENRKRHALYLEKLKTSKLPIVSGGRLGSFKYYDMHQVIGMALKQSEDLVRAWT